jgi:hypothetical protein
MGAIAPAGMLLTERYAPSFSGRGAFAPVFRLSCGIGLVGAAVLVWQRSSSTLDTPGNANNSANYVLVRFFGWTENNREVEMDMREMVDKVKKGEPLYGKSSLTPYMQGVAARNSRYSALMGQIIFWPNFVNHNQHGVDTAKYYQQAERELEAERTASGGS